ncbi:hypothetical protein [Blattabacterium cuenoti]|uniref:hypothetical protein n=1 Tax=Blattabacterium cuenoti TaxID=1653831 RepID=UPI00311EB960
MKKIFIFIFLLFSIIFFSSCHDDGLSGIIDKSELPTGTDDQTKKPSTSDEKKTTISRIEELMRRNPHIRKIIEILNRSGKRKSYSS